MTTGTGAEGLQDNFAMDGSVTVVLGRHGACGWLVQPDRGGALEPMRGCFGTSVEGFTEKKKWSNWVSGGLLESGRRDATEVRRPLASTLPDPCSVDWCSTVGTRRK